MYDLEAFKLHDGGDASLMRPRAFPANLRAHRGTAGGVRRVSGKHITQDVCCMDCLLQLLTGLAPAAFSMAAARHAAQMTVEIRKFISINTGDIIRVPKLGPSFVPLC